MLPMSVKTLAATVANRAIGRFGAAVVPRGILYDWQRAPQQQPPKSHQAHAYLRSDHPRLLELQRRYAACDPAVTTPLVWTDSKVSAGDIASFRADNAWVWQRPNKNSNVMAYALSYYYLRSIDRLGLLDTLSEDNAFGAYSVEVDGRAVSRDLLDSVAEIYFLERHTGIPKRVLDIGAGYGRLAHRMTAATGTEYFCTDAFAASTFVSEYYLRFRESSARVVPLDEIDAALSASPVDLAINIHSFSECRVEAIDWWARLLASHRVKHLYIVPNGSGPLRTNDKRDFLPVLERHGYRAIASEPKYLDPLVQQYGLEPSHNHLLELDGER